MKTLQVDERLSLDADVFYIEWRKIQLIIIVGDYGVDGNGGSALSEGFEWQATWIPINRLTVRLGGAYADARLISNTNPVRVAARLSARLPYIPQWSGSFAAAYTLYKCGGVPAFAGANCRYTGRRDSGFDPELG